jgi:signal transduction histidine kinase
LNPSTQFDANGDSNFQILWEDGDRVFRRGWRLGVDGNRSTVLAVLPAAEYPAPATLDRLAHEYELKDGLDGAWAARPLELVREGGRTRVQLQQVIVNLIMNAVEAMSGTSNGTRELLISSRKAAPGGVLVAVRDSGPSLASANVDHVFEAFYTTKPGGLGMGLSICHPGTIS